MELVVGNIMQFRAVEFGDDELHTELIRRKDMPRSMLHNVQV
jgi:hypothetical protein